MAREILWLAQRAEYRDPETTEVIGWGRVIEVPMAKVMEDNAAVPGTWKVLNKNPNGVNDALLGTAPSPVVATPQEIPQRQWNVKAREAPAAISTGKR